MAVSVRTVATTPKCDCKCPWSQKQCASFS